MGVREGEMGKRALLLPRTRRNPRRPRTHGSSCASMYENSMRNRAWMFCSARFSALVPPCARKRGALPVVAANRATTALKHEVMSTLR